MPAPATAFARLRRSLAGAWLASAYALAVLAGGLAAAAPTPAHAMLTEAALCSGAPQPDGGRPGPVETGEHCKACPASPALALAPPRGASAPGRSPVPAAFAPLAPRMLASGAVQGLPRSRAPPAA